MANIKQVDKKHIVAGHAAHVPVNSSPLSNLPVTSDRDKSELQLSISTSSLGVIERASHPSVEWSTADEVEERNMDLTSIQMTEVDQKNDHGSLPAPDTEPLSPLADPQVLSEARPSSLASLNTKGKTGLEPMSIYSTTLPDDTTKITATDTPSTAPPTPSASSLRSSKRLSQADQTPTSQAKKSKTAHNPSSVSQTPAVTGYIFACMSCERMIRVHSTASITIPKPWGNDRFIPVCCNTCANSVQYSLTTQVPGIGGLHVRLHHHILRNWELHRVAHKAFDLALSDAEGSRPVWTAERAWAVLRVDQGDDGGAVVLKAESIVVDRTQGEKWGGSVRRYRILAGLQKGFLTPADTEAVQATQDLKTKAAGPGKWIDVPKGQ